MANYGSIERNADAENGSADRVGAENTTLLNKQGKNAIVKRVQIHLSEDIDRSWADLPLLGCYIITGLLDSSGVFIYGCFVSMQTGNTIYTGLGLVAPNESNRWVRSGTSVLCFCLGSFFFSRYHRYFTPRKRWVLISSYAIQMLLIVISAVLVTIGPNVEADGPISVWVLLPLALVAFQSAGQAVTSRALQFAGLTSVVLTTNYCDLFSDPQLFTAPMKENSERNRRMAAPILLLTGALLGGVWAHSPFGLAGALWTAAILKAIIVITWFFWAAHPEEEA